MPQIIQKLPKKQRRESRKQEKLLQKHLAEQRAAKKRRLIIWSSVVFGLIVVVLGMIKMTSSPLLGVSWLTDQNSLVDRVKGSKSAQKILVEYSDFQCPACARYYRITKRLIEELGNDFQLIFRHYPLKKHANAALAAKSSEAAGLQGKFWEMHDLLFERQREWAKRKSEEAERLFVRYAASLNLDVEQFESDLHSQAVASKVHNDVKGGRRSGVKFTPTFFLNGEKIMVKPRNYEAFKNLILQNKPNLA